MGRCSAVEHAVIQSRPAQVLHCGLDDRMGSCQWMQWRRPELRWHGGVSILSWYHRVRMLLSSRVKHTADLFRAPFFVGVAFLFSGEYRFIHALLSYATADGLSKVGTPEKN